MPSTMNMRRITGKSDRRPTKRIRHDGGVVVDSPGLYLMGLPFLRRRKSSLIDGAGDDARDLSEHLAAHLDGFPVRDSSGLSPAIFT